MDRASSVGFFLRNPRLLPELWRRFRRHASRWRAGKEARATRSGREWAEQRAITIDDFAARHLGGQRVPDFERAFPAEMEYARSAVAACPVSMGGGADMRLIHTTVEALGATRVLETGVAYGYSSLAALLSLRKRPGACLVSIDMPYAGMGNEPFVECVVPESLRTQWELLRYPDYLVLERAVKSHGPLDLCHYDSDKSYEGRRWAYPILWAGLRSGGVLISDDIGDNLAFADFAQSLGLNPIVLSVSNEPSQRFAGVVIKQ
jgi:predicted O-methyltransferase YrrM